MFQENLLFRNYIVVLAEIIKPKFHKSRLLLLYLLQNNSMRYKLLRYFELIALFIAVPMSYTVGWLRGPKFLPLFLGLVYTITVMYKKGGLPKDIFKLKFNGFLPSMVLRFLLVGTLLTLYVYIFEPGNFLVLPRTRLWLWLAIMVFYPIFSALPQEIIYRTYFTFRYADLFREERLAWIINALLFGWVHIIFHNEVALIGGLLMGMLWYQTYRRTGSIWAVTLEHAMYGNLIYTIGFGHYFYVPDF